MKKALLIIGGLGLLGFGLYKYFKKQVDLISQFTWKIVSVKNVKISLSEFSMDITFLFTSIADLEAKIEKLYLDLYLQNTNVGFISDDRGFVIPAKGTSLVPLHISINPQSIFKNLIDVTLGVGREKDVRFKFSGFAKIKSGFLSTTLPIKYETSIREYLKGITPKV
jgi:LEA14-like dessication related protein